MRPHNSYFENKIGTVVMGKVAVAAVFAAGLRQPRCLSWLRGKEEELAELIALARNRGLETRALAFPAISEQAGSDNHQGILLYADPLPLHVLDDFSPTSYKPLLILDHIEDPHNLGACLRSAAELGAMGVIIPNIRTAPLSPSALKAAAGAVEFLPLIVEANLAQTLRQCQKMGWWTVGASPESKLPSWEAAWYRPVAIVIGGEDKGLSPILAKLCDELVVLPSRVGLTLNASVATSLLLYEAVRPRKA